MQKIYFTLATMNMPETISDIITLFHSELTNHSKGEIDALILFTFNELYGYSNSDLHLRKNSPLKTKESEVLHHVIKELKTNKPIQYIIGKTEFFKCKLRVNEQVLIPRPETEELVQLIIEDNTQQEYKNDNLNILDIGTGSGCIAIALKKNLPEANVSAIDISEEALMIAKANAILNHTKINFLQADILGSIEPVNSPIHKFKIIVSNPPYVQLSEKSTINPNVLDHEPHLALFVNDPNPLLFYIAIIEFTMHHLTSDGKLYFEINAALGNEVKDLLLEKGFHNVQIRKDMSGKDRIVTASL